MHIRQPEITALEAIGKSFVIEPQQMQNGRLEIVNVDLVAHDGEAEFVGFAVSDSVFDSASRQEKREAIRIMVAAQNLARRGASFAKGSPPELAAPNNKCIVE